LYQDAFKEFGDLTAKQDALQDALVHASQQGASPQAIRQISNELATVKSELDKLQQAAPEAAQAIEQSISNQVAEAKHDRKRQESELWAETYYTDGMLTASDEEYRRERTLQKGEAMRAARLVKDPKDDSKSKK